MGYVSTHHRYVPCKTVLALCVRSEERDEVSLYSIAALILKHEGKTSDVLI